MLTRTFPIGAIALTLFCGPGIAAESIIIGAGSAGGPYHRYARAVCTLLSRKSSDVRCTVEAMPAGDTSESLSDIANVRDGAVDVGVARSDWIHFAFEGTGPVEFMHTKFDTIRTLFSIDAHPFTLLAKRDAGIRGVDDLEGRRINLGIPHTDHRRRVDVLMAAKGWKKGDFALAEELATAEQSLSFCHDRVEAIVYLASHPDATVRRLTSICDAAVVDVSGPTVEKILAEHPYLAPTTIPGNLYEGEPKPVASFGTTVALVSSSDVSEDVIYSVVKTVFENLDELKKIHSGLHYLEPGLMRNGLSAPLHGGAERYFRERGWR